MRGSSSFGYRRSATVTLLIALVVAFILQLSLESTLSKGWVRDHLFLSLDGLRHGFVWQLLTYQFLHGGVFHLLMNGFIIFFFGREMEEALGRKRFVMLYLGAGVLGGLLQVGAGLLMPSQVSNGMIFPSKFAGPVVGASAGAFGLIAAFASLYPDRVLTMLLAFIIPVRMQAKYLLLIEAVITLIGIAFLRDNVAHMAHLGGMLTGMAFIKHGLDWEWPRFRVKRRRSAPRLVRVGFASTNPPWSRQEDLSPDEFLSKEVDPILEKISSQGIQSLTEGERKILERARDRMGKR